MEQNLHITGLFRELFDGDPWLDVTTIGTLQNVSAEKAARKPKNLTNSIWEIVNHISSWREVVLARIHGAKANTPEHNYFLPIEDQSETAWKNSLENLHKSQETWLGFLSSVTNEKLSERYLDSNYSVYDLVFGIMQHDAYHLGQLTLLVRYEL